MTLIHGLVSSALVSGVIFAATTLPLSVFGSQPITLKVEEEPLFSGRLEELATPYLTLATILSLGVGAATFSFLGWQSSARKLSRAEEQIAALKQQIQEKEALVEHFKFSEKTLQSKGLDSFLEARSPAAQPQFSENRYANHLSAVESHSYATSQEPEPTHAAFVQSAPSPHDLRDAKQVEALLLHMKQVMAQIEKLQAS